MSFWKPILITLSIISITVLSGCSSTPPPKQSMDNLCSIYSHESDWKYAAKKAYKKWGTPPYVLMAFVHQESRFKHDAQPSRLSLIHI